MAECYKTIEYPDRKAIAALYAAGAKAGQIAKEIGVAPRTIYAELMVQPTDGRERSRFG